VPDRQAIQVPGLKTIGPYSQAVRATGLLFVSGQPGVDPSTGEAAGPTFDVQARQAFKNLDTVLRAGGSRLDLVVKLHIRGI
jgi:2-iminobutanoate/2-iminopropanoate deaminase